MQRESGDVSTAATLPTLPPPLDPDGPYSVVMVCTGNICRSALAHMVLLDRLVSAGASLAGAGGIRVTSAGVSDEEHGNPVDSRARRVLVEHGYGQGQDPAATAVADAVSAHAAHRISDSELKCADLVLAMTAAHRAELERRATALGLDRRRVRMFREFDPLVVGNGEVDGDEPRRAPDVADPWYGTMADFEETLDVVERVCDALAATLMARD